MNALVNFRANALGNLSVTHKERQEAMADITASYRAKLTALAKQASGTKQADGANTQTSSVTEVASNELGRDAFLQLLVLELQNQDPLEPVDNSDMIAQLAQFSSLEQMENLNGSFDTLSGNIDQLNFISAQGLLGKQIEGVNQGGQAVAGTVNSVYLDGSIVVLNVDGEIVPMSNVLTITGDATSTGNEAAGDRES